MLEISIPLQKENVDDTQDPMCPRNLVPSAHADQACAVSYAKLAGEEK